MNAVFDYVNRMLDGVEQRMSAQQRLSEAFARAVDRVGMPLAMSTAAKYIALDPAGRVVPPDHIDDYIAALEALQPDTLLGAGQPAAAGPVRIVEFTPVDSEAEGWRLIQQATECAAQEPRAGSSVESTDAPAAAHAAPDYAALELELVDGPLYEAEALSDTARDRALGLHVLLRQARTSAFPSLPKMPPEWWSAVYLATDALQAAFGEVA
jgi:hypothetical protein